MVDGTVNCVEGLETAETFEVRDPNGWTWDCSGLAVIFALHA